MKRLLLAVVLILAPAGARADFADGAAAFDGGDYGRALAEWRALARAGDAQAQSALASLYRYGHGVARDSAIAAQWYGRAAAQGEVNGQLNLGEMYANGVGVPRDPVRAYLWLSLAADQGRAWAARERDRVAGTLSAAALARARALVRDWRPQGD